VWEEFVIRSSIRIFAFDSRAGECSISRGRKLKRVHYRSSSQTYIPRSILEGEERKEENLIKQVVFRGEDFEWGDI
jgi:hypothetical protein